MKGDLTVNPNRSPSLHGHTGIYVRAIMPDGKWGNADIAELDVASLRAWLRSRGGANTWAESVVLIMLGYRVTEGGPAYVKETT